MALGVSIVVPAFNEERRLPATLARLANELDDVIGGDWEVVVVDDGSTDRTGDLARDQAAATDRIRVVSHHPNRGKGAALARGFAEARLPHVFFMDADAPVPLDTIARFRDLLAGADVVAGTRRAAGAAIDRPQPIARRIAARSYLAVLRAMGLAAGSDPQCGAKLLRRDRLDEVVRATAATGYAFDVELLVRTRAAGLSVIEAPVVWRHVDGSSIRPWHDGWRTATEIVAVRRRLRHDGTLTSARAAP